MLKLRGNKGITLVALIITIIILLILAGITIGQLTGSGIFDNAKKAKEASEKGSIQEEVTIAISSLQLKAVNNGKTLGLEDLYSTTETKYNLNKANGLSEEIDGWEDTTSIPIVLLYKGNKVYIYEDFLVEVGERTVEPIVKATVTNENNEIKITITGINGTISSITAPSEVSKISDYVYKVETYKTSLQFVVIIEGKEITKEVTLPKIEAKKNGEWTGTVNSPKLSGTGLTPVYWTGSEWKDLTDTSTQEEWNKWYSYTETDKKWANARSKDGSMWVWIPRYEYKITYNNTSDKSQGGTIDINFIQVSATTATTGCTIHPSFTNDIANGGWSSQIPGFWVAKYAAGYQNGTVGETAGTVQNSNLKYTELNGYTSNFLNSSLTTNTNISYPVFKANTYAYNIISAGDIYLLSQEIDGTDANGSTATTAKNFYGLSNVDSHMQKNSEWGAVAYLAHSKYGVNTSSANSNEITINSKNLNDSVYVNNASSGTKAKVYAVTSYGNNNTANDINASSTKNITGVFDLNGCIWEYKAGYLKGGQASTPAWHESMATLTTLDSTKYVTLYESNNKIGDATNETSTANTGSTSWNGDYSLFVTSSYPVFLRGGDYVSGDGAGVFAFRYDDGSPYGGYGFRVVLVAQ